MQEIIFGQLRHVLGIGGTWLVTKGLTDESGAQALAGGLFVLIGMAWSAYSKRKAKPVVG